MRTRSAPVVRTARLGAALLALTQALMAGCGGPTAGGPEAGGEGQTIVVSNYGVAVNGMPFAVARARGYFEAEGAHVTGILSSSGGGSTIRNLEGGNLAYAETSLASVVAAAASGAKIRIVSGNAHTAAEFHWITMPDSPVKTLADVKGRRLGFTTPRSTSQALNALLLRTLGLRPGDVSQINTGGFGQMLVALERGGIDVAPMSDPIYTQNKGKYRLLADATSVLPALTNVVGVTSEEAAGRHGDFIRAVIRARRRAVADIYADPAAAAAVIAPEYKLDVAVTREILERLVASGKDSGVPYWGPGDIRYGPMDEMIKAQQDIGALSGPVDWTTLVDVRFLPDDLQGAGAR